MPKELSIFIDESGDFGKYDPRSPYYIIGMVMHEQKDNIKSYVQALDVRLTMMGLRMRYVHIGPLIRKEQDYKSLSPKERSKILRQIIFFAKQVPYRYKTFVVEKRHSRNNSDLIGRLAQIISSFINEYYNYFSSFDKIKIYYDNGQAGVMQIILTVFTKLFQNSEIKKALQKDYKMLQVADLVCTAELTELKMKAHTLSRSERRLLGDDKSIKKNFLRPIKKKEFSGK